MQEQTEHLSAFVRFRGRGVLAAFRRHTLRQAVLDENAARTPRPRNRTARVLRYGLESYVLVLEERE